ncbi:hypothetical protein Cni_G03080 [Canna indica]|uniref:Uncharacterized protein n=1 Tax=Canna indica TaxID=4628 RepID=A0AAQ3JRV8_9LILI|nr:hypothetical protein Cni_G03080 [Canna indica]
MDRFLKQYDIELIRNTMMKHEEIFRNQLHELHHLYRIQKMLIAELRSKGLNLQSPANANSSTVTDATTRLWSSTSISETSHNSHVNNMLSLKKLNICSKDPWRVQKTFDLEQPTEEYNLTDESTARKQSILHGKHLKEERNTEGPHNWTDDENGIELTLSIGCGTDKK